MWSVGWGYEGHTRVMDAKGDVCSRLCVHAMLFGALWGAGARLLAGLLQLLSGALLRDLCAP